MGYQEEISKARGERESISCEHVWQVDE